MELKNFIATAIEDISDAVLEADRNLLNKRGMVNPPALSHETASENGSRKYVAHRTTLDFDIAVSSSSEKEIKAGGKAKIWVVEASAGGGNVSKHESVSRLTFSLDVILPPSKDQALRLSVMERDLENN